MTADAVEMVQDQPEFVIPDATHVRLALRDPTCRKDYDAEVNAPVVREVSCETG